MNKVLVDQTNNAFEFIRKLYFEISYLIKEVEGLLQQEEERFVIGQPSGYAVTSRTSSGLEPMNVELWFPKDFTVFFCPDAMTERSKGPTITPFSDSLRVLLLRIEVNEKHLDEPRVLGGYLCKIKSHKPQNNKFEKLMSEFAYRGSKIFAELPKVSYESAICSFKGEFFEVPLFSINDSDDVETKLVDPMLKLYREQ